MKIYQTLGQYPVHGKVLPMYSVVLRLDDNKTEIICTHFNTPRKYKLNVIIYDCVMKTWTQCKVRNKYTEIMWNYYRQTQRKSGSGGVRLGKFTGTVTDYECTKNPMHDFRRVYN